MARRSQDLLARQNISNRKVFPLDLETNSRIFFVIHTRKYAPIQNAAEVFSNGQKGKNFNKGLISANYYYLPIPQQGIRDIFNMYYPTPLELGALGGSMESLSKFANDPSGQIASIVGDTLGVITKRVADAAVSAGGAQLGIGTQQAEGALELVTGIIENPNLALLFKGVQLRNHTFEWRFMPRSQDESRAIADLVRQLKSDALPSKEELIGDKKITSAFLLKYPHVAFFEIRGPSGDLITFNDAGSFITDIRVDYTGGGELAFFKNTLEPAEVILSIALTERRILTREDNDTSEKRSGANFNLSRVSI